MEFQLHGFKTFGFFSVDHQFLIYKSLDQRSGKRVLLKLLRQKKPTIKSIQKIYHDFRISNFVKGPRIQNSLELIRHEDVPILVIEDCNSVPLSRLFPNGVNSIEKFFEIAMGISLALKEIHEKKFSTKHSVPTTFGFKRKRGSLKSRIFHPQLFRIKKPQFLLRRIYPSKFSPTSPRN